MFLKYSFVLRVLLKAGILIAVSYAVQYLLHHMLLFSKNWYWLVTGAILFSLLEDKISIERKHTLIYLPIKSELSVFEWLENRKYKLMRKMRNRRVYVDRADKWYERNDFVRITLMENKLKLKLDNNLARHFELDFLSQFEEETQ